MSPAPIRIPSSAKTAPLSGIISANNHQISCACSTTASSLVNSSGITSRERVAGRRRTAAPSKTDQPIMRTAAARARPRAGAEHPPDHDLRGDRHGVEHEREEHEQLEGDLVRAERRRADPGQRGRGDQERRRAAPRCARRSPPRSASGCACGRARDAATRRAAGRATNAAPMPSCAITVPQAEPARPQSNPYTNSSSSTTLTACAATRMISGVRRSPCPAGSPARRWRA